MSEILAGIRVQLAASIPPELNEEQQQNIRWFVESLTRLVLSKGGVIVHGSHPTIVPSILKPAKAFLDSNGSRDSIVLVRSSKYDAIENQLDIQLHRKLATVEVIPSSEEDPSAPLISMREWMSERCDVLIAVGGKHYDVNESGAGVVNETKAMLSLAKPCFIVTSFGGAVDSWLRDDQAVFARLKNGLSEQSNNELSRATNPEQLAKAIVEQIGYLPLSRTISTKRGMFRILCLDGGGIRGAFTASILNRWATMFSPNDPKAIIRQFDLVAGTSTGSILAAGLGAGLSPASLVSFYQKDGPKIFKGTSEWWRLITNKYSSVALEASLSPIKELKFSDSICRLVIPSIDAKTGRARVFVTPHAAERTADREFHLKHAVLASTAAPTYFAAAEVPIGPKDPHGRPYTTSFIDGGLWANNPAIAAISEAIGPLDVPIDRIDVLSVGTMETEHDFSKLKAAGKIEFAASMVDLFFTSQESATTKTSRVLLTKSRFLRINREVKKLIGLDDAKSIRDLIVEGDSVARETFDEVLGRFLKPGSVEPWKKF